MSLKEIPDAILVEELHRREGKISQEEYDRRMALRDMGKTIISFTNIRHLVQQIIAQNPIFYDNAKNYWIWNKKLLRWERCDETDMLNLIDNCAEISTTNARLKNEMIEGIKQEGRKNKPKDIKKTWIQFKDKIYDIEDDNIIDASPDYFVTNPIPWELHPDKYIHTPTMDKIFEEWVGKKYVQTLYEIIAYCLLPDYPLHRIFCFVGSGMNGKGKFFQLIQKFIGNENICSTELDNLLTSRFEVIRLHKKLICQMGETNFNEMSKTSMLKKLSGNDLIGFEYKRSDLFEDTNYAKIMISTNNLPTTTDKTRGFYRRWMIIDFPNEFSEKKDILDDIPLEEYNALALKCCHILKDILKNRKFNNEGTIDDRQKRYEERSENIE